MTHHMTYTTYRPISLALHIPPLTGTLGVKWTRPGLSFTFCNHYQVRVNTMYGGDGTQTLTAPRCSSRVTCVVLCGVILWQVLEELLCDHVFAWLFVNSLNTWHKRYYTNAFAHVLIWSMFMHVSHACCCAYVCVCLCAGQFWIFQCLAANHTCMWHEWYILPLSMLSACWCVLNWWARVFVWFCACCCVTWEVSSTFCNYLSVTILNMIL